MQIVFHTCMFQKSATVTKVVDVKDWPDDDSIFDTTKSIVTLLYVMDPWLRQTDGAPITVICRYERRTILLL